uniref:Uncharacterized protein n=1 Tax=Alexandrium monilatum TaxID=311494 RepID=A0A7S4SW88_9DINO
MADAEPASPPSKPGDCVLVSGLESEGGRPLNGRKGIVTSWLEDADRFEVRLGPDKVVRLKTGNLQRAELEVAERLRILGLAPQEQVPAEALPFEPGQAVEVFGLESEGGRPLNGQRGTIAKCTADKGRIEVRLESGRSVSLKADNLRKTASEPRQEPPPPRDRSRSRPSDPSAAAGAGPEEGASRCSPTEQERAAPAPEAATAPAPRAPPEPVAAAAPAPEAATAPAPRAPPEPVAAAAPAPEAAASAAPADEAEPPCGLRAGHCVEVFGLQSESGRELNGQTGIIARYIKEKDRFEVRFIPEKLVSLRADSLRKVEFGLSSAGAESSTGLEKSAAGEDAGPSCPAVSGGRSRSRSRSSSPCSGSRLGPRSISGPCRRHGGLWRTTRAGAPALRRSWTPRRPRSFTAHSPRQLASCRRRTSTTLRRTI